MSIVSLHEIREGALARVRQSLIEQEEILKSLGPTQHGRVLVECLIKSLKSAEARLASGLPADRRVLSK